MRAAAGTLACTWPVSRTRRSSFLHTGGRPKPPTRDPPAHTEALLHEERRSHGRARRRPRASQGVVVFFRPCPCKREEANDAPRSRQPEEDGVRQVPAVPSPPAPASRSHVAVEADR